MSAQSVVVLGGGISGLAAAYYLTRIPAIKKIILIDKRARLGGWIQSTRYPCGTVDEHGPHSIRSSGHQGANTLKLIEELKLSKEVLPVTPVCSRARLIYCKGRLHWLPNSFSDFCRIQAPFSSPLIFAMIKDLIKPRAKIQDESLYSFCQRRFNDEVAKYVADPMCRGICGGDSKEISVRSLIPAAYNAEQLYGSVARGLGKLDKPVQLCELARRARVENWGMFSFRLGLQTLVDALVESISSDNRVSIYENEESVRVSVRNGTFTVYFAEGATEAQHLFSCVPAKALSRLLSRVEPSMSSLLLDIPIAHLVSCTLEFEGSHLSHQAFGYLVPSSESSRVLGMIFDTACFPEHDGQYSKKTRVTCLMGGHWFTELFGDINKVEANQFTETAIIACQEHLRIQEKPVRHLTNILQNCIPQYRVGHYATIQKLKEIISEKKLRMSLLGSSYEGLSVNDCIYNAKLSVERYAESQGIA